MKKSIDSNFEILGSIVYTIRQLEMQLTKLYDEREEIYRRIDNEFATDRNLDTTERNKSNTIE
jgi:hypothetical protein